MSAVAVGRESLALEASTRERSQLGALLVMLTGVFMASLDFFIVNVAIPSTQRDLHASAAGVEWIVAGYALPYGAALITGGRLGDLFGRRRMFMLGMALFLAASTLCGVAPSVGILVAARVGQGAAAALMSPQVLAILGTMFEGEARARAINAYGMTMGLGAVFGQLIGGALIQANVLGLGWRACFLINLPVGLSALAMLRRLVPESRSPHAARLDVPGVVLVALALTAVVLPLIEGREQGWPVWVWLVFAAAGVLLTLFVSWQRRVSRAGRSPLVDLSLFSERAFSLGMLAQGVFWMGQASFFLVFALFVQGGLGLDPLDAGLVFLPIGIGYVAASMAARTLAKRLGGQTIALGAAIMLVAEALMAVLVGHVHSAGDVTLLTPALLVDAVGMGLAVGPLAGTVLSRVPAAHAGAAAGVLATGQQLGNAIGVAIIGVVFYGALHGGTYIEAFRFALLFLGGVAAAVVVAIQLLQRRTAE